jgi:hypothetical protein
VKTREEEGSNGGSPWSGWEVSLRDQVHKSLHPSAQVVSRLEDDVETDAVGGVDVDGHGHLSELVELRSSLEERGLLSPAKSVDRAQNICDCCE